MPWIQWILTLFSSNEWLPNNCISLDEQKPQENWRLLENKKVSHSKCMYNVWSLHTYYCHQGLLPNTNTPNIMCHQCQFAVWCTKLLLSKWNCIKPKLVCPNELTLEVNISNKAYTEYVWHDRWLDRLITGKILKQSRTSIITASMKANKKYNFFKTNCTSKKWRSIAERQKTLINLSLSISFCHNIFRYIS